MCGIAGIIGAHDPELENRLQAVLSAQDHRGPDDSGLYRSGEAGVLLGFRRLAILDLSADGHQPMIDEQRGNVIVFNGEIYNFAEIRRALEELGENFRSKCDTEVLLRAYAHFGTDMLGKLRGMFAFAIYDARQRRVFLARDRLGIKPLYYAEVERPTGKVLLFASELRSLLASGLFPRRADPVALSSYHWNGFVVGPNTMIRGISSLPAGTSMTVQLGNGKITKERYWALGPRMPHSPEYAKQELEAELLTAAQQHLISDVPLGIFLSGGVDSSAVAALAVRAGAGQVKTFHISFEEAGFDESRYARQVADALHTDHAEFRLTQSIFVSQLDQALKSLDQPTLDAINTYYVSRIVREAGFTVALAGTGGDELFGGYQSFRQMPKARQVARAMRVLPTSALNRALNLGMNLLFARRDSVPPQTRWAKLGGLLGTRGDELSLYQVFYALFTPEFLSELEGTEALSLAPYGLTPEMHGQLSSATAGLSPLAATSAMELALFLGERLLRDSDAASMAVSLELRVPLLDHRVVEAAQRTPDDLRFSPIGKKQLLRTLAMPNLDQRIFDRPKAGFVLPIAVWAKDKLAHEIESTFADRALVESIGLRPEALQRLWRAFLAGAPGMYWSRVWAPYVLLNWCRAHRVGL